MKKERPIFSVLFLLLGSACWFFFGRITVLYEYQCVKCSLPKEMLIQTCKTFDAITKSIEDGSLQELLEKAEEAEPTIEGVEL